MLVPERLTAIRPGPGKWFASLVAVMTTITALLGAASCSPATETGNTGTGSLRVVCTTGMVADLVRRIGGTRVNVVALMGEGVDPHLYKASPGDLRLLTSADLVFYSGLHLEGRMGEVLEKLAERRPVVAVTDSIDRAILRQPPEFKGNFDPHVWFDVSLWSQAADRVLRALAERDPPNAMAYGAAAGALRVELATLHEWCKEQIQRIPPERRVLVTAHDAFGYFGRAYGIDVLGIQGISTDSEASLRDMGRLVDTIVQRRVPAVFIESSVPRKTIEALVEGCRARGHQVTIGGELFSDAMGREGTDEGTYPGMVRHNVLAIVKALSPTEPPAPNDSTAPKDGQP